MAYDVCLVCFSDRHWYIVCIQIIISNLYVKIMTYILAGE